jgi:quercetin dioxygenase-like cupin family protein
MIRQGDQIKNIRTGQVMKFLQTAKETNGDLLEIECFSPPTDAREPEHFHPMQENIFKVMSGELSFRIDGKEQMILPGEEVTILPGVPHHFWNSGVATAHYLQEFRPALNIDQLFETFFALARDGRLNKSGAPNIFRTALIMLFHQKELRIINPSWRIQKILFALLAPLGRLMGFKSRYEFSKQS